MGEVVDWMDDPPRTVGMFDAYEVLAWLAALGLVTVDIRTVTVDIRTVEESE